MPRTINLFKRFPRLRWKSGEETLFVSAEVRARCPALEGDHRLLDERLMPDFRELDNEALRAQNQFRLEQVLLIIGTTLTTILGAVQAARAGDKWPGIVEAVLAAVLAVTVMSAKTLKTHETYSPAPSSLCNSHQPARVGSIDKEVIRRASLFFPPVARPS